MGSLFLLRLRLILRLCHRDGRFPFPPAQYCHWERMECQGTTEGEEGAAGKTLACWENRGSARTSLGGIFTLMLLM
jgi:hypothetical protein